MHTVILPKIEPNMEEAMITKWLKKENDTVQKGEPLFLMETAKASIEVEAEESGVLRKILVKESETVPILTVVALVGGEEEPLPDLFTFEGRGGGSGNSKPAPAQESPGEKKELKEAAQRILSSPAARRAAQEKSIDLRRVTGTGPGGRIVEEDVKRFRENGEPRNILIVGAGKGGEVVADILSHDQKNSITGFVDDNREKWGTQLLGKPVFGGIDMIEQLYRESVFDSVIISITASMKARKEIYETIKQKMYNLTFVNAIHPNAYINPAAAVGEGNIIGAFVHIGYGSSIGNNNLITAGCNIEHHNVIGSHILFGPGVMTSGEVAIGDGCSLGAGVNIEPHVKIGNNVAIASGTTIISDVPAGMVIKKVTRRQVREKNGGAES